MLILPRSTLYCGGEPPHCPQATSRNAPTPKTHPHQPKTGVCHPRAPTRGSRATNTIENPRPRHCEVRFSNVAISSTTRPLPPVPHLIFPLVVYTFLFSRQLHWLRQMLTLPRSMLYCECLALAPTPRPRHCETRFSDRGNLLNDMPAPTSIPTSSLFFFGCILDGF